MISEITLYETEDGKRFEDYEEAEKHGMELRFGDVKKDIKWKSGSYAPSADAEASEDAEFNDCELYDAEYVAVNTQAAVDWFNYCMTEMYGIDCPIGGVGKWMFNGNEYVDLEKEIRRLEAICVGMSF